MLNNVLCHKYHQACEVNLSRIFHYGELLHSCREAAATHYLLLTQTHTISDPPEQTLLVGKNQTQKHFILFPNYLQVHFTMLGV